MTMRGNVGEYEVLQPRRLEDALAMLKDAASESRALTPLAGGTDLLVLANFNQLRDRRFVNLWELEELRYVYRDGKGPGALLRIGALATYTDCIGARHVRKHLPILAAASREVGGVQIQNRGTIAGNIGNGSPAGDSLPVLMAADARVVLRSVDGEREIPLTEYYTGYRATVRRPDELIVEIRVPLPDPSEKQVFRKVGTRAAQAISKVVMAAIGHRISFGSVGPTVLRARKVEQYLNEGGRDLAEAQRLLQEDIKPIDDIRSTADYRRKVAANLLRLVLDGKSA